jgi:hypothetical protein
MADDSYAYWFGALESTVLAAIRNGDIKKGRKPFQSILNMIQKSGTNIEGILEFQKDLEAAIKGK